MKTILILSIMISCSFTYGQDTIMRSMQPGGKMLYAIADSIDTFFVGTYPNGSKESVRTYTSVSKTIHYKRFYPNGKLMWKKTLLKNEDHGISSFYNSEGVLVAKFNYERGVMKDTLYLKKNIRFILGRGTYYSVVYGGMQRADGSSNISGGEGVYMFYDFYLVKMNHDDSVQKVDRNFSTDFNGHYFLIVDEGAEYGLFPNHYDIKLVKPNMGSARVRGFGGGIDASWNIKSPIKIGEESYQIINLHYHSVGYAP